MLTRAEPSVLRAGVMAGLAATAFVLGRQAEPLRLLALAVVALLLLDPLLAWSVGFWLSVGATAGVVLGAVHLAPRLVRLGPLALPVAVTLGAQCGVAVPSLLVFGRLSLTGTVANIVAVPVAGLVMLVGTAGVPRRRHRALRRAGGDGAGRLGRVVGRRGRHGGRGGRTASAVVVGRLGGAGRRRGLDRAVGRPSPAPPVAARAPVRHDGRRPCPCTCSPATTSRSCAAAVTDLVHELVGDGDRSLMVDEFDGDDVEVRAVVDSAQTPPFLTERRVVVARDVGRFSADELAPLVAYLADPLDSTALVLVGGGGRIAKSLTDAVKQSGGTARSTDPPSRARDRQGWVGDHAAAAGVKLSPPAAALVAERLGEDVGRLDGLLATLAATFGSAAAAPRRCRAVHRRGRRRAAVGSHRRHRRRQHVGRARRPRPDERTGRAPPARS